MCGEGRRREEGEKGEKKGKRRGEEKGWGMLWLSWLFGTT